MALFLTPEEHAANGPETWTVRKAADRIWQLRTTDGAVLDTFKTKREAEINRTMGHLVRLYQLEGRWMAGEQAYVGWKPYSECADRMRRASEARQARAAV